MSEQPSTPPRPKPGSLRDRIAAFEKPAATAAASPPPPVPRPKPGGLQWKPKVPSPPSSPSASEERKHGSSGTSSMSASDAKESIGKGGSLKERMAALQNKGAFGAPPPVAPKPPLEKPKWKPPPVIAKVDQDEDEAPADQPQQQQQPSQVQAEVTESPQPRPSAPARAEVEEGEKEVIDNEELAENQSGEPAEVDPEEEERQRRAAIAARMARLGGTRVGMAPMFGAKPMAKPPPPPQPTAETKPAPDDELISDNVAQVAISIAGQGMASDDIKSPMPARKDAESAESPPTQSRSTPSMPMPSAPRRTGPPRKKVPKTPEIPPAVPTALGGDVTLTPETVPMIESTVVADSIKAGDRVPEMDVPDKIDVEIAPPLRATAEDAAKPLAETAISEPILPPAAQEQPQATTEQASLAAVLDAPHETIPEAEPRANEDVAEGATPAAKLVAEPVPMEEHMEEDEAEARRRRVAERLAKMGAVNPFAPQRRSSQQSVERDEAVIASSTPPPPIPPKRMSMEKRKSSIDSVSTVDSRHVRSPVTSPSFVPLRKDSVSSTISDVAISSREGTQDDTHVEPATIPEEIDEPAAVEPFSARTEESNEPSEVEDAAAPLIIPARPTPGLSTRLTISQEGPIDPALSVEPFSSASPVPAPTATPPAKFIPPPRITPRRKEFEYTTESDSDYRDYDSDAPPRRIPPRVAPSDENMDNESAPLPVPNRSSLELKTGSDGPPPPPPLNISTRPTRSVPLPPQPLSSSVSDLDQDSDNGEILPMRPRNQPTSPALSDVPLYVPPPQGMDSSRTIDPSPLRQSSYPAEELVFAGGVEQEQEQEAGDTSPSVETQDLSVSEHEVLDEEEGDPIDPTFHSPSRPTSTINLQSSSAAQEPKPQDSGAKELKDEAKPESEEDAESTRRRTLAERMAKLGGIKFGAASIPAQISRPPPPPREVDEEPAEQDASVAEQPHVSEEEEERARKERIAAKLASMGGMRIGMLPPGAGVLPVPRTESNIVSAPPPPSQPTGQEHDEDEAISASQHSLSTDDGVKVEAEESDMEEVKHEEVREMEEVPPPVPSRAMRRQLSTSSETVHVAPPVNRPPVPTGLPSRRSSVQTTASATKRASTDSTFSRHRVPLQKPQSEYVMVEEPEEMDTPTPPPPKPANRPHPPRAAPPPPPPSADTGENISSQWVLPSIPSSSLDMSDDGDLSMSWSKESVSDVSAVPPAPPEKDASLASPLSPVGQPNMPHDGTSLSADELMAVWGRVGVQVCEVATSFFEKSKKSLVGDGTYAGFVLAVLHEVPNAVLPHRTPPYGALVYAQHGGTVQKRTSDIMPGDVVELVETKFKGHKGIHAYNQSVGFDETVVGIVSEFEHKKSKMRVFQANQHVGQQTVEAVSYRLEDLKSGDVKVYRVLENK